MYGTPPAPGKGRDVVIDQQLIDQVKANLASPPPELPAWQQFEWNGVRFTWVANARFEGAHADGWSATVHPDGIRWKATIRLVGGAQSSLGDFPNSALNNAALAWQEAVGKIKLGGGP